MYVSIVACNKRGVSLGEVLRQKKYELDGKKREEDQWFGAILFPGGGTGGSEAIVKYAT
jgi:hypothetical protein